MPTSEAIYLLTAFSKMAASRSVGEATFVEAITSEIYQVSKPRRTGWAAWNFTKPKRKKINSSYYKLPERNCSLLCSVISSYNRTLKSQN